LRVALSWGPLKVGVNSWKIDMKRILSMNQSHCTGIRREPCCATLRSSTNRRMRKIDD